MCSKKAAMSKGLKVMMVIFATVIIVVILLGVILAFLKGSFKREDGLIDLPGPLEPQPAPATSSNPLTLSRDYISIKPGEHEVILLSVFNPLNETQTIYLNINCTSVLTLEYEPKNISPLQRDEFVTILKAKPVHPDTYLCKFISQYNDSGTWREIATKNFTVNVR
ncbi:hypothetical protein J7L02_02050 [Candidatus Woesearchaeota archaeon]|nr:hypothetical protein [Candidatus Woesearchaeota archaeon]